MVEHCWVPTGSKTHRYGVATDVLFAEPKFGSPERKCQVVNHRFAPLGGEHAEAPPLWRCVLFGAHHRFAYGLEGQTAQRSRDQTCGDAITRSFPCSSKDRLRLCACA